MSVMRLSRCDGCYREVMCFPGYDSSDVWVISFCPVCKQEDAR